MQRKRGDRKYKWHRWRSKGLMTIDVVMKVAQCAVDEVMNDLHERQ